MNNTSLTQLSQNNKTSGDISIDEFRMQKVSTSSIQIPKRRDTPTGLSLKKNICPSLRDLSCPKRFNAKHTKSSTNIFADQKQTNAGSTMSSRGIFNNKNSVPLIDKLLTQNSNVFENKSFRQFLSRNSVTDLPTEIVKDNEPKKWNYEYSKKPSHGINLSQKDYIKKPDMYLLKPNRQCTLQWVEMNETRMQEQNDKVQTSRDIISKAVYSGRGEIPRSRSYKIFRSNKASFLDEVKQLALNTQIDVIPTKKVTEKLEDLSEIISEEESKSELEAKMDLCSIDDISPIKLVNEQPSKKNFVIKTNGETQSNHVNNHLSPIIRSSSEKKVKAFIFPSSISHIGSKVNETKRYHLKGQNIFINTKTKNDLFDEIMDSKAKHSTQTISTTTSTLKSKENNWYMQDKTKKCVRAMQQPNKDVSKYSYIGNLDKNDPGHKKVRFVGDLKSANTSSEIGFYSGFSDKRDKKAFKKDMLFNNWNEKIVLQNE